ncbi:hypothetical protein [Archangium sp. Cb G35]|uniref:hypothetical protein n=1 Tax=Archangium sp. Cb G35 TaxID=1920190 RepID=UPI000AA1F6EF|nr:hypothetical protein [Archangium sp. Cb G35]
MLGAEAGSTFADAGTPATIDVEMTSSGELLAARLGGRRRWMMELVGPERLSGDW